MNHQLALEESDAYYKAKEAECKAKTEWLQKKEKELSVGNTLWFNNCNCCAKDFTGEGKYCPTCIESIEEMMLVIKQKKQKRRNS